MDKRITHISQALSDEARAIYLAMIPEYQEGYVNYVFQTDKEAIQQRRIKNLDKSFRKLPDQPYFYVQPLAASRGREIAQSWSYPAPFDYYNISKSTPIYDELMDSPQQTNQYFEVIHNGAFIGYFNLTATGPALEIKLGLKPERCGQGLGQPFYQATEAYLKDKREEGQLTVLVPSFDQRAQKFFLNCGYALTDKFAGANRSGQDDLLRLTKTVS